MSTITCHYCKKSIRRKADLVTIFSILRGVKPYHARCWGVAATKFAFGKNPWPINGKMFTIGAIVSAVAAVGVIFLAIAALILSTAGGLMQEGSITVFILLLFIGLSFGINALIRLYSYNKYEKVLS